MQERHEQRIRESVERIFSIMQTRVDAEQMKLVKAAYELAAEAHKDQKRKTGEPYIIHPIAVAGILAEELEMGANPVIAAFLHDVVEDTNYTLDDIRKRFGDDVAFLVGVVTKKKKKKYDNSKQVDNFRQILFSVQFDVRAILVKLADRLHNMRTLDSMRPDKQMKIAGETDYFYAPLANRLGLYQVKAELENLSFRYRCPREYKEMERLLEEERNTKMQEALPFTKKAQRILKENGLDVRVELRQRNAYSIWRKMQSKSCDFQHVDGKHYTRIIFDAPDREHEKEYSLHSYAVLSNAFKERPGSVMNYINTPKENGYQSLHVKLLNERGLWEEVHIASERMIRNNRLGCAAEQTATNVKDWLERFKEVLRDVADHTKEIDFMDSINRSIGYNDDIITFTPKGDSYSLPKGSTAIDFAFEVHTAVGMHAHYARINGVLSSMKTKLQRGDCVEIFTSQEVSPDDDWINYAHTYKAIRSLNSLLASRERPTYNRCLHCHPLPGDEVIGFTEADGTVTVHKRNCPTAIRRASEQGDAIVAVNYEKDERLFFPVRIRIRGIDRHHLLIDIVACITEEQNLSISKLTTVTTDRIVETSVDFEVNSSQQLQRAILSISQIKNVDEVACIDIE